MLLEKTQYIQALEKKGNVEDIARIENIQELKTNIVTYMKETGDESLSGFLDDVALYTDLDTMTEENDCVTMMTMHSAKGLEFPVVFIVGAEEGIFPGLRTIGDPEEMEEERRLCYVAMTRAQQMLYLTCARQRMIFGRTTSNLPSRFVEEIPEEDLDKGGVLPKRRDLFNDEQGVVAQPGYGSSRYGYGARRQAAEPERKAPIAPPKAAEKFVVGDRVNHKVFGLGTIQKMTPMGGDALVEIEFAQGTKKLMLKVAAANMTKAE